MAEVLIYYSRWQWPLLRNHAEPGPEIWQPEQGPTSTASNHELSLNELLPACNV